MTDDDTAVRRRLERVRSVEWNAEKAKVNRHKHGIDFEEAIEVFYSEYLLHRSDRNDEERWVAIGESEGRVIALVFAWRGSSTLRIISARRARKNEEREYRHKTVGGTPEG